MNEYHSEALRKAAERRTLASRQFRVAIVGLNAAVREARQGGMSAVEIAETIGTTRQRVYEILREG